eukprot:TRINITY_DN7504_c0_g2_i4.p1 TRINITY_DN7504_c0_g2~~TRINITY_DN7504_c0_g2_i4.p1  ORF type:complete len:296 (-),score=50.27 TRINITY_DN7504_c0_g2_i4:82-870(-)
MGNCLVYQKKENQIQTDSELLNESCAPNIKKPPNNILHEALHNSSISSKECHVKLARDRGKPIVPIHVQRTLNVKRPDTKDSSEDEIRKINTIKTKNKNSNISLNEIRKSATGRLGGESNENLRLKKRKSVACEEGRIFFQLSSLVKESKECIMSKYSFIESIGKGSFGEVYKVQHLITKKIFAAKIISKAKYEETNNVMNEIEILKSLVPYHSTLGPPKHCPPLRVLSGHRQLLPHNRVLRRGRTAAQDSRAQVSVRIHSS